MIELGGTVLLRYWGAGVGLGRRAYVALLRRSAITNTAQYNRIHECQNSPGLRCLGRHHAGLCLGSSRPIRLDDAPFRLEKGCAARSGG